MDYIFWTNLYLSKMMVCFRINPPSINTFYHINICYHYHKWLFGNIRLWSLQQIWPKNTYFRPRLKSFTKNIYGNSFVMVACSNSFSPQFLGNAYKILSLTIKSTLFKWWQIIIHLAMPSKMLGNTSHTFLLVFSKTTLFKCFLKSFLEVLARFSPRVFPPKFLNYLLR